MRNMLTVEQMLELSKEVDDDSWREQDYDVLVNTSHDQIQKEIVSTGVKLDEKHYIAVVIGEKQIPNLLKGKKVLAPKTIALVNSLYQGDILEHKAPALEFYDKPFKLYHGTVEGLDVRLTYGSIAENTIRIGVAQVFAPENILIGDFRGVDKIEAVNGYEINAIKDIRERCGKIESIIQNDEEAKARQSYYQRALDIIGG